MPCHTRMKLLLQGLFWLFIFEFGFMVTSLEPGFLDFDNLPDTNFSCVGKVIGGYYADLETSCQMFHVCTIGQLDEPMDIRFLCLNGTVFDQETRVCERIDEVDCSKSEQFYSLNLELYGNTQPPILEESPETDSPSEILKQSSTTTTTTTIRPTQTNTPRQNFIITTSRPTTTSTKTLSTTHPPVKPQSPKPPKPQPQLHFASNSNQDNNPPDIRFNPEEYKISLNAGSLPDIRTNSNSAANDGKPISFQAFSDNNKRVIVTTHTTVYKNEHKQPTSSKEDSKHDDYDSELSDSTEDGYSYGFNQPESLKVPEFHTELPKTFHFRPGFRPSPADEFKSSTYRPVFHPATSNPLKLSFSNNRGPTTYRNHYPALKPFQQYYHRPEKPPSRLQLPVLPTLPSLTFSSPAPFSLNRHIETKRFIDHRQQAALGPQMLSNSQMQHSRHKQMQQQQQQTEQSMHHQVHHQPPRIVISASASVSDANGRKFNYSLGTIGDSRLFGHAPSSYDDYKEADVGLDPFYHDVPKIRHKRQIQVAQETPPVHLNSKPIIVNSNGKDYDGESEAIDVLKFLFNWYNNFEKTSTTTSLGIPIKAETITEINDEFTPKTPIEYLYDEVDINLGPKQVEDYRTKVRNNFEKPYLSLQLLKPPAVVENFQYDEPRPKISTTTTTTKTPPTTITTVPSTSTTTPRIVTTTAPETNIYYDYVDDNYEPLTYQQESDKKLFPDERKYPVKETYQIEKAVRSDDAKKEDVHSNNYKEYSYLDKAQDDKYYSSRDYVDDNYEPIVYSQREIIPPAQTEGHDITTKNSTNLEEPEVPSYSKTNTDKIVTTESPITTSINSVVTSTATTENYNELLGLLGFTTQKPKVKTRQRTNRGKTRFSLTDINVPADIYQEIITQKSKGTSTLSTSPTTTSATTIELPTTLAISSTTDAPFLTTSEGFEYTINENRRTQDDFELTTEAPNLFSTTHYPTSLQEDSYVKLGESTLAGTEETAVTTDAVDFSSTTATVKPTTDQTNIISDATESYTTVQLKKLIEEVEQTTKSIADISTISDFTSRFDETTVSVPTTLIDNISTVLDLTDPTVTTNMPKTTTTILSLSAENVSSTSSTSTPEVVETTISSDSFIATTSAIASTIATTITTPTPSSAKKSSRRRSKSRFRQSSPSYTSTSTTPSLVDELRFKARRKPSINEEIIDVIKNKMSSSVDENPAFKKIEFNINAYTANLAYRQQSTTPLSVDNDFTEEVLATDPPISKSANPTLSASKQRSKNYLPTTPITRSTAIVVNKQVKNRKYTFNCFDREVNRFYSDPRDCRLFHYCTRGFTKTQYLDMKFVCDLGTFFDEQKLICTREQPARCL